jgi:hypothetical protein
MHKSSDGSRVFKRRASLANDTLPGRPDSARSNENVEKTRTIVKQDRRIATTLLTERLGVGKEAKRQILETDLKKMKIIRGSCPTPYGSKEGAQV